MVLPAVPPRQHPPPAIATDPVNGKAVVVSGVTESTVDTIVITTDGNTVAAISEVETGMAVVGIDTTADGRAVGMEVSGG